MKRLFILTMIIFALATQISWSQFPNIISYQGILTDANGDPVSNGYYRLTFNLYDSNISNTPIWTEIHEFVSVTNGIFNVILGSNNSLAPITFSQQYWLGIAVGTDLELSPRIKLTSSVYSLISRSVIDGAITTSKINNSAVTAPKIAGGEVVKSLNGFRDNVTILAGANITITPGANTLTISATGGAGGDGWSLAGNAGTNPAVNFLGTTDNKPLTLRVNNSRALYIEPASPSPNIVGGFGGNSTLAGVYGAVIGGGGESTFENKVTDSYGTVGGGMKNQAGDQAGAIDDRLYATVSGGYSNKASAEQATIGGGGYNLARAYSTTVGGGYGNDANAEYATIAGGGRTDSANSQTGNRVTDNYGTIGGGGDNQAGDADSYPDDETYATVAGGKSNSARGSYSSIGGGEGNAAGAANESHATVCGGKTNAANKDYATVVGGRDNIATETYAFVGGGRDNMASGDTTAIAGGEENEAIGLYATIGAGFDNAARGKYSFIGGGIYNEAGDAVADEGVTVAGGYQNIARGYCDTIAGGFINNTSNTSGSHSTIGGGFNNETNGLSATIPGGSNNVAQGDYSFAAGRKAKANHNGAFVWGDSTDADITSVGDNQFIVRADGGIWFGKSGYSPSFPVGSFINTYTGAYLSTGGAWTNSSSRELKENFAPVNKIDILERLSDVPISRWNYKAQEPSIRHIGPVAQDFYASFGVGEDNEHISTVDANGVALAAIQGLYELLKEKEATITAQQDQIEAMERRLEALEATAK